MAKDKKHIHFVGVSGVAMAPLAVLYKQTGWKVTGSDRAFYPPMSTYLHKHKIHIMPGYKAEHLSPLPDMVVVSAFLTKKNPEVAFAMKKKIPVYGYGQILSDFIEKEHSIVVAGDHGKTTITALIAWVLEKAKKKPSFMIGGVPLNFADGMRKTVSDWSVIEGDEYPVLSWKKEPRFLSYHPRYLVIPDVHWDHMNIYPTPKKYLEGFLKLVKRLPNDGLLVLHAGSDELRKLALETRATVLWYDSDDLPNALRWVFPGRIWAENAAAVYVLATHLGISGPVILKAFQTFKGVKRRQEVRFKDSRVMIIDDFAHSPVKVAGSLESLRTRFPDWPILAVYEPGDRSDSALSLDDYPASFRHASMVILPQVTAASDERRDFSERLARRLAPHHSALFYINDDEKVLAKISEVLRARKKKKTMVVFMSQRGFRGMIEEVVKYTKNKR